MPPIMHHQNRRPTKFPLVSTSAHTSSAETGAAGGEGVRGGQGSTKTTPPSSWCSLAGAALATTTRGHSASPWWGLAAAWHWFDPNPWLLGGGGFCPHSPPRVGINTAAARGARAGGYQCLSPAEQGWGHVVEHPQWVLRPAPPPSCPPAPLPPQPHANTHMCTLECRHTHTHTHAHVYMHRYINVHTYTHSMGLRGSTHRHTHVDVHTYT